MIDPKVFQEMEVELQKLIKRELRDRVDRLESNTAPEEFEKTFQSLLSFGWTEIDSMAATTAEWNVSEVDPLLNHLFFTLGEGTLSGALGTALICDLLARRLLRNGKQEENSSHSFTFPLFMEPDFLEAAEELRLVPRAAEADALVLLLPQEEKIVFLGRKEEGFSWQGPIETLGIRSCPLYDVRWSGALSQRSFPLSSTKAEVALSSARGWLLSLAAGLFSGGLQKGILYAKERYQGGDFIFNHTGLQAILSRLQTTLWNVESLVKQIPQAVREEGKGVEAVRQIFAEGMESLTSKVEDIIQVFGGYGYMEDFIVERVYRDVSHLAVALGRRGFDRMAWPQGGK